MDGCRLNWLVIFIAALVGGCAISPTQMKDPRDPLEPFNRAVFRFNTDFDKAFLQPVAKGYRIITPKPVDRSISNFFYNLADVTSAVNNLLQFKMSRVTSDVGRVLINSSVGIFGLFDVATNVGLPSYKEDFGQTLGYWGLGAGPYFVLPILGPSSIRDTVGWAGNLATDPLMYVENNNLYNGLRGTQVINQRAEYLAAGDIINDAALDSYSFMRDAYLQRRLNLVHDGNPPTSDTKEDFWEQIDFENKK